MTSKFKQLQSTGQEAELFFMNNYKSIDAFKDCAIEDARLYGDGYDFQLSTSSNFYLTEIKGVRYHAGNIRLTKNEYGKADRNRSIYFLVVISNLIEAPKMNCILNPLENISFKERKTLSKIQLEYHTGNIKW